MPTVTLAELCGRRADWRRAGRRLVFSNGVFDLLHAGHVDYLNRARALGDLLILGLNSDASVRAIKGPLRPLVPEAERAAVLAALRCVDYVTLFAEPTAESLLAALQPEVYVKGADYATAEGVPDLARLPEARLVLAQGGRVELLPYQPGLSTSALIARILERYAP
jgi:D-glycero-beta-D-manno-heptose 1-phosphate adenylyltransferase